MLTFHLLLVLFFANEIQASQTTANTTAAEYTVCPQGSSFKGQELFSVSGRSPQDCAKSCETADGCLAVNVCQAGASLPGQVTCSLMRDWNPGGCGGLDASTDNTCVFLQKQAISCQNGGTVNGAGCHCPIQFSGQFCQRYISDCPEAYENGYTSSSLNGVYLIQPALAPRPFPVQCSFNYGGSMYVMKRVSMDVEVTWSQARDGFGDDLQAVPASRDFFVGLEQLHLLTAQTSYSLLVWMYGATAGTKAGVFYQDFKVGSEASLYSLAYSSFAAGGNAPGTEDGFATTSPPVTFSSRDRDAHNCSDSRGAPGWYGADCSGYSLFSNTPRWPVGGALVTASSTQGFFLSLQRL